MNRRAFLTSMGCTAALTAAASNAFARAPAVITARHFKFRLITEPEFEACARGIAHRLTVATEGRMQVVLAPRDARQLPTDNVLRLGSLQSAVSRHPAFGYAAGLPGQLGLPLSVRIAWLTGSGQTLWRDLQDESGLMCLTTNIVTPAPKLWSRRPIGDWSAIRGETLAADGLAMDVARGLGARARVQAYAGLIHKSAALGLPVGYAFNSPLALQRVPDLIALTLKPAAWTTLDAGLQHALRSVAFNADQGHDAPGVAALAGTAYALPDGMPAAIDRVSEAVVATVPGFDSLSQRINASYFALRAATADLGTASTI